MGQGAVALCAPIEAGPRVVLTYGVKDWCADKQKKQVSSLEVQPLLRDVQRGGSVWGACRL